MKSQAPKFSDALDAAIAADGGLWILAGGAVRHYSRDGNPLGEPITCYGFPLATIRGAFSPGEEVGCTAGWPDMPYSIQAMRRKNGEYLVLVKEDFRGKNLLYRWRPDS